MSRFKISSQTPSATCIRSRHHSIFILISGDSSRLPGKDSTETGSPGRSRSTNRVTAASRAGTRRDGRRGRRMACGPIESSELTEVFLSGQADAGRFEEESGAAGYASEPPTVSLLRARRPSIVLGCTIVASNAHPSVISATILLCTPYISLLGHVTFIVVRALHTRELSPSCIRHSRRDAHQRSSSSW